MKNLKQFKELIQRYEKVTMEQVMEHFDKNGMGSADAINSLFRDGNGCILCIGAQDEFTFEIDCRECVYGVGCKNIDSIKCLSGENEKTYYAMNYADTPETLLQACRNRAEHMKKLLIKLNIDL